MIALVRKETEALAPYWLAIGVLIGVNALSILWRPDFVLEAFGEQRGGAEWQSNTLWILSLLVGHGAVAHELRDGHVEFLDALPTTRAAVFASKLLACLLPVLVMVGASLAMDVTHAALATPTGAISTVQALLVVHGTMLAAAVCGLGVGMALSWLGALAWGVVALGALIGVCAGVVAPPLRGWEVLIGTYGRVVWDGSVATHPAGPVLLQLAVGVVGVGASGALFVGPGAAFTARSSRITATARGGVLGCGTLLVFPLAGLSALAIAMAQGGAMFQGVETLNGQQFRVLYAPGDRDRAEQIAAHVGSLSDQIGRTLGNDAPISLDVEILGAPANHLGVFTGGKIRLAQGADDGVLAHELAHAHAYALAGEAAWHQRAHTHFFEEGLAEWAKVQVVGGRSVPTVVGAIWETGQVRFDELVESDVHRERHDLAQSYALGQAFADALHDVAGEGAIACVLRGIGARGDRPVAGLALWYGVARACDFDLDTVLDAWVARMVEARARLPAELPQLRATMAPGPAIAVVDERGLGWPLSCSFRPDADAPPNRWVQVRVENGVCAVPTGALYSDTYEYMVGYDLPPESAAGDGFSTVFMEWTAARLL